MVVPDFFLPALSLLPGLILSPGGKVALGGEEIHVHAHFRNDDRGAVFHRWYGLQELICFLEVEFDLFLYLLLHGNNYFLHGIDVSQRGPYHALVVFFHVSHEGLFQFLFPVSQSSPC